VYSKNRKEVRSMWLKILELPTEDPLIVAEMALPHCPEISVEDDPETA